MELKPDINHVVEELTQTIGRMSKDIAILKALVRQYQEKLSFLEKSPKQVDN